MNLKWLLCFALAAYWMVCTETAAAGAVPLDTYTFGKVLAFPGHSILVKFDVPYASGEKEDEFELLCKLAHKVQHFFVAEVQVYDEELHGKTANDELRNQFKLVKSDFPAYFLFNEAHVGGLRYTGSIKAAHLTAWLRKCKIQVPPFRANAHLGDGEEPDEVLEELEESEEDMHATAIGTISRLDKIAKAFLKESHDTSQVAAAKQIAEELYKSYQTAQMYVAVMESVKAEGESYIDVEATRVAEVLDDNSTHELEKAQLSEKLRVLRAFSKDEL